MSVADSQGPGTMIDDLQLTPHKGAPTSPGDHLSPLMMVSKKHTTTNRTNTNSSSSSSNKNTLSNGGLAWKPTILIVDDSATNRKMLVRFIHCLFEYHTTYTTISTIYTLPSTLTLSVIHTILNSTPLTMYPFCSFGYLILSTMNPFSSLGSIAELERHVCLSRSGGRIGRWVVSLVLM